MIDWKFLRELCAIPGVSGDEDRVRERILRELASAADEIRVTPLGCVIAHKQGKESPSVRVMLCAHMDEPGFIVTRVCEDGTVRLAPVGELPAVSLCGRPVKVCTAQGDLPGVLGAKPVHLLSAEERGKTVPMKDLYLDIGALSREEARKAVRPGDRVVFDSPWKETEKTISGRALAGRAACAVLLGLLSQTPAFDLTVAFTTLGETGAGGIRTAACDACPDAVIVVGAAQAGEPGENDAACRFGEGPAVSFMDGGTVYDRALYTGSLRYARGLEIPCQERQAADGGVMAGRAAAHTNVRALSVGIPCRYPNAPVSLMMREDLESMERFLTACAQAVASGRF